jgi:hypothetical protein
MNKLTIPTLLLLIGAVIYIILLQIGCASCLPAETRCADNVVQICDSNGFWYESAVCRDIGEVWTCCGVEEEGELYHTCQPEMECSR